MLYEDPDRIIYSAAVCMLSVNGRGVGEAEAWRCFQDFLCRVQDKPPLLKYLLSHA